MTCYVKKKRKKSFKGIFWHCLKTCKKPLFVFYSKIHFLPPPSHPHNFIVPFPSIKSQRRRRELTCWCIFLVYTEPLLKPLHGKPVCFTTIPQWPGDLEEGALAWKSKHLTVCQKQEGPALWDSWRFYVSEGTFPLIISSAETQIKAFRNSCVPGRCRGRCFMFNYLAPNLPERKIWE